jgi:hypothetical protein
VGRLPLPPLLLALAACATAEIDPRATGDDPQSQVYWTDLQATYHGRTSAAADEEAIEAGLAMASEICDRSLLDASKLCARPRPAGDTQEIRCRLQCRAHSPQPGPTLATATLFLGGRPVALRLDRVP